MLQKYESSWQMLIHAILAILPSVSFKGKAMALSNDAKAMLATVASKLKNNAGCSITVTGYPAASKASQALCNKRVACY